MLRKTLSAAIITACSIASAYAATDCGKTPEQAVQAAKVATTQEQKVQCLSAAVELLTAKVEGMRTGKVALGAVQAEAYLHAGAK